MRHSTKLLSGYRHRELRLNCWAGTNQTYLDPFGLTWISDAPYVSGASGASDQPDAVHTPYPELFRTQRFFTSSTSYNLALDNGIYDVQLFWSETFFTQVGQRLFGLEIQGRAVLQNFDLIREGGGVQNRAITRMFRTHVTNRNLAIRFLMGSADNPTISAMCVTRIASLRR